jgi:hypothetical protein
LADDYWFCFYDKDKSLCTGQILVPINDCAVFVNYTITDPRYVNMLFTTDVLSDCVIDLARFANATTVALLSLPRPFSVHLLAVSVPPDISLTEMIVVAPLSQTGYTSRPAGCMSLPPVLSFLSSH